MILRGRDDCRSADARVRGLNLQRGRHRISRSTLGSVLVREHAMTDMTPIAAEAAARLAFSLMRSAYLDPRPDLASNGGRARARVAAGRRAPDRVPPRLPWRGYPRGCAAEDRDRNGCRTRPCRASRGAGDLRVLRRPARIAGGRSDPPSRRTLARGKLGRGTVRGQSAPSDASGRPSLAGRDRGAGCSTRRKRTRARRNRSACGSLLLTHVAGWAGRNVIRVLRSARPVGPARSVWSSRDAARAAGEPVRGAAATPARRRPCDGRADRSRPADGLGARACRRCATLVARALAPVTRFPSHRRVPRQGAR